MRMRPAMHAHKKTKRGIPQNPRNPLDPALVPAVHCFALFHETFGPQYSAEYSSLYLVKVTFQVALHNQSFSLTLILFIIVFRSGQRVFIH